VSKRIGQSFGTTVPRDVDLVVSAGSAANGLGIDCGASDPCPIVVLGQFSVSSSSAATAAELEVRIQHSDDNQNWPDDDQGHLIFSWMAGRPGAGLGRSEFVSFRPKRRYYRFRYLNHSKTDSFTVWSRTAHNMFAQI